MQFLWIRDLIAQIYMIICWIYPLETKKIAFKSDRGKQCSDSPLALFNTASRIYPEYKLVWILKDPSTAPEGCSVVKEGSLEEIKALATAKFWVDNKRKGCWIRKRKGQVYIQTWHGPIALKKIEKDVEEKLPSYYVKSAKHDSRMADYFLSSSAWTTEFFRKSFWYEGRILEFGTPRSDIFYKENAGIREKILIHYKLNQDTKILLYAPTFRDDGSIDAYDMDYLKLKSLLESRFGGFWKILLRLHPNIIDKQSNVQYNHDILNGNEVNDINELIIACDALITDYSSCMFDAMEAGKKVILYASDIEKYRTDRGFYFSVEDLPFCLVENMQELESAVLSFDEAAYMSRIEMFKSQLQIFNKGDASERILSYLLKG